MLSLLLYGMIFSVQFPYCRLFDHIWVGLNFALKKAEGVTAGGVMSEVQLGAALLK
jgi:hypothetical protein